MRAGCLQTHDPFATYASPSPTGKTMSQSKVLGAAIYGAGWVAGEHARAYQACSRTQVVAVGSRKLESARKCAQYAGAADAFTTTSFDELLKRPDVDLVSITTPP